ncbi:hypothetical protein Celaphus_00000421 [Cervus elaphus hippelaphus]|uniref:Uncharacterized protein n=1 Tax=Cervus elaphus hippelaphus TaxID=46360 RepID=A0A212D9W2_CEREH|nr:hypothetical protein Celaphus_00000421 [Cervus elaphus hippelaphus]
MQRGPQFITHSFEVSPQAQAKTLIDLSFSSNAECVRIYCFMISWNQGYWEARAMGVATRSSVRCQPPRA